MRRFLIGSATALLFFVLAGCSGDDGSRDDSLPGLDELGDTEPPGNSSGDALRLLNVESCAEIEPIVAPLLTGAHELIDERIENRGYPGPGPYSFVCVWEADDGQLDRITVDGRAGHDSNSADDIRAFHPDAREITTDVNLVLLESPDNWPLHGRFTLFVPAPDPPNTGPTSEVWVMYGYGGGAGSMSQPYNGHTQQLIDESRGVPDDATVRTVLVGLIELSN